MNHIHEEANSSITSFSKLIGKHYGNNMPLSGSMLLTEQLLTLNEA